MRSSLAFPALVCAAGLLAAAPAPATAGGTDAPHPLDGRVLAGVTFGRVMTTHGDLGGQNTVSPFFRWNSRRDGWGPSFGFSWSSVDLRVPVANRRTSLGEVRLRPVMLGAGYTVWRGPLRAMAGLVAGYAFNSASVNGSLPANTMATLDIDRAWAAGPKVDFMYAVRPRLAVIASAAYVFSDPRLTARAWTDGALQYERVSRIRADSLTLRVGAAISLF